MNANRRREHWWLRQFASIGGHSRFPLIAALLRCVTALALALTAHSEEKLNDGQDFTRPLTRFDLRYNYQDKGEGVDQNQIVLRLEQPIPLSQNWKIATRLDLPTVFTNKTGSDNPKGLNTAGLGDVLTEVVLIDTFNERFAYGAGLRVLYPTANADQFGGGKFQLIPIAGARYFLPEISEGSYFEPVVRYDFDAGGRGNRSHVSQFQFSPTLNIKLPERWYLTLFPSQDIVLNTIGGHKWFVPADFLVGRNITKTTVASVEVSIPIVKEFTLYDFKFEARISHSF